MRADAYICDSVSQCRVSGELEAALASNLWPQDREPSELGQVVGGMTAGRQSADDITICDLTGTGAQDTAIATHVRALISGAGTVIQA